jgi:hypothetical protein
VIELDRKALLGGGVPPRETMAGKIGASKDKPSPKPEIAIDPSLLLKRDGQAHGAKIGDGKMMSPFARQMPAGPAKGE